MAGTSFTRAGVNLHRGRAKNQLGYRGIGPRGYRPSDYEIFGALCQTLADDPRIDASDLTVRVRGGLVLLSGTVPDAGMGRQIVQLARSAPGVASVINRLHVPRRH